MLIQEYTDEAEYCTDKQMDMEAHTSNPITWEVEAGREEVQCKYQLSESKGQLWVHNDTVPKQQEGRRKVYVGEIDIFITLTKTGKCRSYTIWFKSQVNPKCFYVEGYIASLW